MEQSRYVHCERYCETVTHSCKCHLLIVEYLFVDVDPMKRVTSVLRRFHLIKEPPESDTRQRLKKELFACNSVSCISVYIFDELNV